MPGPWKHRLQLKDLLTEEYDSAAVEAAAKGMYERLETFRLANYPQDEEIEQLSDEFHTIAYIDGPAGVADVEEFNRILNFLYDWADTDRRLWVE